MGHAWATTYLWSGARTPSLALLTVCLSKDSCNKWRRKMHWYLAGVGDRFQIVLSSSFQMGRQAASRWNSWTVILPFVDEFWQGRCFEEGDRAGPALSTNSFHSFPWDAGGGWAGREEGRQEAIRMQSAQISSSTSHCLSLRISTVLLLYLTSSLLLVSVFNT